MSEPIVELELYMIRHGQSAGNAGDDVPDPPLTDKGHRQAELLGEYFAMLPLDHILVSGLRRALQTATEVAIRQPENGAHKIELNKLFCETNTNVDEPDRPISETVKEFPLVVPADGETWESSSVLHTYPEPLEARQARTTRAVQWIRERYHNGEKVMLVAHGGFNTCMVFSALGIPRDGTFDPNATNTGITKIVFYKKGHGRNGCDINLMCENDHSHLYKEYPELLFDMR